MQFTELRFRMLIAVCQNIKFMTKRKDSYKADERYKFSTADQSRMLNSLWTEDDTGFFNGFTVYVTAL
jgi:hypothetical protein